MSEQNSYLEELRKNMASYTEETKKSGSKTRENVLTRFFNPRNPKELFRILPPPRGRRHIQEAFFHTITLNGIMNGSLIKLHGKKVYCPAHNDPKVPKLDANGEKILDQDGKPVMVHVRCPVCEKSKEILKTQDQSIRGVKKIDMNADQLKVLESNSKIFSESNKWSAKKFYIIRGVDKGNQKDGVKFWRFKYNYRKQGVMDKLSPVLDEFIVIHKSDFANPNTGCDISITMADSEFNGRPYKAVSAIGYRPPSKLHDDPIIAKQWIDDKVTWRDVFLPKKAPNTTPLEFLEMAVLGNDPYWDDSDPQDKKWRFPGNPDLEAKANDRSNNLDEEKKEENFEQASDLTPAVNIDNVNESNVGAYSDSAVEVGETVTGKDEPEPPKKEESIPEPTTEQPESTVDESGDDESNDYDDLPF